MGGKCEIMQAEIQSVAGDNWETSAKSCGQRIQSVGDKCEIMRAENPECLW